MPRVVGVNFKEAGKLTYYEIEPGVDALPGEQVIVETEQGTEMAEVVTPPDNIPETESMSDLKPIVRKANDEDMEARQKHEDLEKEGMYVCQENINKQSLEMKLVDVECLFDETKMIFYFSAESRVDFRQLVKDLAAVFKKRIEMRQIGVRDEAKIIGGLGSCGRRLCCNSFLQDFEPVSVKFAKEQNLPLNPFKISGICGRLMCCLRFEYEQYKEFNKKAPKRGSWVKTAHGDGKVVDCNAPRESVVVQIDKGIRYDVPLNEIQGKAKARPKVEQEDKTKDNEKDEAKDRTKDRAKGRTGPKHRPKGRPKHKPRSKKPKQETSSNK